MNMKRMITSALAILLLAGAAQAQGRNKGDKQERREDKKELNLSADQKTKLKDIHSREKAEMDALRSNTSLSKEQQQARRKEIHEKYVTERKALLTPEQQKKAAEFREGMKDRRGPGGHEGRDTVGRHGGPGARGEGKRGDRMKEMQKDLNLTAAQQDQLKALRDQYRPKHEAIRNNTSLTQEQKRQQSQELMKAQQEQMKSILTAEQLQKMQQKRQGGRKKNV
jgi:Spy/CpxP family protein refolding chaperone